MKVKMKQTRQLLGQTVYHSSLGKKKKTRTDHGKMSDSCADKAPSVKRSFYRSILHPSPKRYMVDLASCVVISLSGGWGVTFRHSLERKDTY